MNTTFTKKPNISLDKNELLSQADQAFDSMTEVLLELEPPKSIHISQNEENFFYELNYFIEEEIKNIEKIRNHLKTNVEWDQLNVAFFGETNAGKSSLIEAILSYYSTPTSGETIGDGRKDFTKNVRYHTIKHKGKKVGLIDLPGIEGDESGNLDDIDAILRKGITKAHIVFYVYGNNKKPEPATASKIKKYLDEQAMVFSICNNRGKAGQYRRLVLKEGKAALKSSEVNDQSKEILTKVLGKQYKGDFFVNSLAAYLSVGKIVREDFKIDKTAFLEVFKTEDQLRSFSNLKTILDIILEKSKTVEEIIFQANRDKLNHVLREVTLNLKNFQERKISKAKIEVVQEEITHLLRTVKDEITKSQNQCKNTVFSNIDYHFQILENKITKLINESNVSKEKVNDLIKDTNINLERVIKKSFKDSEKSCLYRIENRLKQLDRYSSLGIGSIFLNLIHINDFDLEGLNELDISFWDFGGFLLSISPLLIGGPPGWIAGGIGFIGWGITKLLGDGGKGKAIAKVSDELRAEKNKLKLKFANETIKQHFNSFETKIFNRLEPMQNIPNEMLKWKNKINTSKNEISNLIK